MSMSSPKPKQPFARFQSLAKRLLAVPKAEADKQRPLATKKPSPAKKSSARG